MPAVTEALEGCSGLGHARGVSRGGLAAAHHGPGIAGGRPATRWQPRQVAAVGQAAPHGILRAHSGSAAGTWSRATWSV